MLKKEKKNDVPIGKIVKIVVLVLILVIILSFFISLLGLFVNVQRVNANVVVIPVDNVIVTQSRSSLLPIAATTSDEIVAQIEQSTKDPKVKAIVFEINSPGGSAVASHEIVEAIKEAREANKTTVSVIREIGASGAYWVASSTEHIIANPLSITGSVGVTASYLEISGLLERYNVSYQRVVGGKYKDIGSPFKNLTDEERELFEERIAVIYEEFLNDVAENRNLNEQEKEEVSSALFYIGKQAQDIGLVDELGNMDDAITYIEEKENIKAKLFEYRRRESLLDRLLSISSAQAFWLGKGIGEGIRSASPASQASQYGEPLLLFPYDFVAS